METSILDDYSTNCLIMAPTVNQDSKALIINILKNKAFFALTKPERISWLAFFGIF